MTNNLQKLIESLSWQPIEDLPFNEYHGYSVSRTVLLRFGFPETNITNIKAGRVWHENGVKSLPDNPLDTYDRVNAWMPLPPGDAGEVIRHYHATVKSIISLVEPYAKQMGILSAINEFCEGAIAKAEELAKGDV